MTPIDLAVERLAAESARSLLTSASRFCRKVRSRTLSSALLVLLAVPDLGVIQIHCRRSRNTHSTRRWQAVVTTPSYPSASKRVYKFHLEGSFLQGCRRRILYDTG